MQLRILSLTLSEAMDDAGRRTRGRTGGTMCRTWWPEPGATWHSSTRHQRDAGQFFGVKAFPGSPSYFAAGPPLVLGHARGDDSARYKSGPGPKVPRIFCQGSSERGVRCRAKPKTRPLRRPQGSQGVPMKPWAPRETPGGSQDDPRRPQ